jgi:single-stranded-DNA-specific exonuclease
MYVKSILDAFHLDKGKKMKKNIVRRAIANCFLDAQIHPVLQRIYVGRGIQSTTDLERNLINILPYQDLSNIELAITYLVAAMTDRQHIMIIGDFDADGATSTALAVRALRSFGAAKVSYLVPNRFEYGYGLTPEIVEVAAKQHPDLLITVDNGITSHAGVLRAKELNMKVLITDHHLSGGELPVADAIVNPNLSGDIFASKNLAGVGVIFYVMMALRSRLREIGWFAKQQLVEPNMAVLLDLVALGTIADVVPLDKNNRILVHQGLLRIRAGKTCPGIKALLEIAGRHYTRISASDLGYAVAPRLNAAGRLVDMSLGIECLLCDDPQQARIKAIELDQLNQERKTIEANMREQALQDLADLQLQQDLPIGLCLFNEKWHQGVIGILASRLKDLLHRPAIVFAVNTDTELKGSARSVPGLHIRDVLETIATQYPGLITKFGGHAMAAGLSIKQDDLDQFCIIFNEVVSLQLSEELLQGLVYSDGELTSDELCLEIAELIQDGGPWGQGFPEPIFEGNFQIVQRQLLQEKHLKFLLSTPDNKRSLDAIAFNVDHTMLNFSGEEIYLAYRLGINEYRGQRNLQLIVDHFEVV